MQFDLAILAIPLFLVLIGAEALITRWQARPSGTLDDTVSNLGCGMLQQFIQLPIRTASFAAYLWLYGHYRLVSLPSSPWAWALCFLVTDFAAYWYHRLSHRVAILWASHSVHHQSEALDLTVSLRVPALDYYYWVFDLPLAVLGFPPGMFLIVSSVVSIYGFSSHTQAIGRLGFVEWLFVTPSHHQLHHASNPEYLDRNYGKVLIVWDRLFGTFVEETPTPVYGLTVPMRSRNPVWANLHAFVELARKVRRLSSLSDRFRALLMPPEWEPSSSPDSGRAKAKPAARRAVSAGRPARAIRRYVLAQFTLLLLATVAILNRKAQMSPVALGLCAGAVILSLGSLGGLLDGRRWASALERSRLAAAVVLLSWLGS